MFRRLVLLVTVALVVLSAAFASQPTPSKYFLQLWVEPSGRVWWHIGPARPDSLPIPVSPVTDSTAFSEIGPDEYRLYHRLLDRVRLYPKTVIPVIVHPRTHYGYVNNILGVIDQVEAAINDSISLQIGVPIDSLRPDQLFNIRYGLQSWRPRDDKILNAACEAHGLSRSGGPELPEVQTFLYQYKHGAFESRVPDMINLTPPKATPPKSADRE